LLANERFVEEHFIVYNRLQPSEKYRLSLKLTTGTLRTFFLAPGPKNAYPFWTLEDNITGFLRDYSTVWLRLAQLRPELAPLLLDRQRPPKSSSSKGKFQMFYLTDELLYYALKHEGHVGDFALKLANLIYSVVFRH
ncbi:unnamed protein product, partial [Phaeothamnion confervicola]